MKPLKYSQALTGFFLTAQARRLSSHTIADYSQTLDMVKRYLSIVQTDIDNVHRHASPVDNWAL